MPPPNAAAPGLESQKGTHPGGPTASSSGTFVPLPPWIITHEQAIEAARELARRETEAARRDAAEHRRAERDQRRARKARRLREDAFNAAHLEEVRRLQLDFHREAKREGQL